MAAVTEIHRALAIVAAAAVIGVIVTSGAMAAGVAVSRSWLDRAILAQLAAAAGVALAGLGLAITAGLPSDPLHLLYGSVLLLAPVVARYVLRAAPARAIGRTLLIVGVVTLGIAVRAFMTGG